MIVAAVAGAWLGAGFVSRWPRRGIQIGMGVLLLVARHGHDHAPAVHARRRPGDGARRARCSRSGVAGNFVLGALMTIGIGLYAPCLVLVSLLGMNDAAALPDHDGLVRVPDAGGDACRFVRRGATTCAPRWG